MCFQMHKFVLQQSCHYLFWFLNFNYEERHMRLKTITKAKGINPASQAGKREPSGSISGEYNPNAAGDGLRYLPLLESLICQHPKYLIPPSLQLKKK